MANDTLRFPYRFRDEQLRAAVEDRAVKKGISVNEWLNRCVEHGIKVGGKTKVTTTVEVLEH